MDPQFSADAVAHALRRYLDGDATADDLGAYLSACDDAIRAAAADPRLSGPVGTAMLIIMEQAEGVRPPADVRSALLAVEHSLSPATVRRRPTSRAPIPPPRTRRRRRT